MENEFSKEEAIQFLGLRFKAKKLFQSFSEFSSVIPFDWFKADSVHLVDAVQYEDGSIYLGICDVADMEAEDKRSYVTRSFNKTEFQEYFEPLS